MTPVVPFLSARSRTNSQPLIRPAVEPPGKPEPPPMKKCDSRPATLVRRKTTSLVEAPRIDYFSSRTVVEAPCPITWEPKGFQQFAFPTADLGIKEEDEDSDTSDSDLEWGVQENMKLFEVSAKDDQGGVFGLPSFWFPEHYLRNSRTIRTSHPIYHCEA